MLKMWTKFSKQDDESLINQVILNMTIEIESCSKKNVKLFVLILNWIYKG